MPGGGLFPSLMAAELYGFGVIEQLAPNQALPDVS
jgi:hypothetical protein